MQTIVSHSFVRWRPTSSIEWSVLLAVLFGLLNLFSTLTSMSPYHSLTAIIAYVATVAVLLVFAVLWWKLVEGPTAISYLRGGLVGLLAGLTAYLVLSLLLVPLSILGLIAIFFLWATALYTIPNVIIIGVIGIAIRKRA